MNDHANADSIFYSVLPGHLDITEKKAAVKPTIARLAPWL